MRAVVNTHKILDEKPAKLRHSLRWNGRFEEHIQADIMDRECEVLFVARRPVTDRATVFCGENNKLKCP